MRMKLGWRVGVLGGVWLLGCEAEHLDRERGEASDVAGVTKLDASATVDSEAAADDVESLHDVTAVDAPDLADTQSDALADVTLADVFVDTSVPDTSLTDVHDVKSDTGATDTKPTDTKPTDTKPKDTNVSEDVVPTFGYRWVRVTDSTANSSLTLCILGPGADIDAIEVKRDDVHLAYGDVIISDINKDPLLKGAPCPNTSDDPDMALGAPDGTPDTGLLSLNGGSIRVQFADAVGIQAGDVLTVYEFGLQPNSDPPVVGVPEKFSVEIAQNSDGPWIVVGDGEGETSFTIAFPEE